MELKLGERRTGWRIRQACVRAAMLADRGRASEILLMS